MLQKNLHTILPRLALLSVFCVFIEVFRILLTVNITYIFLPWNLFLAWVPLWLTMQLKDENRPVHLCLYLVTWLFFFPNAPYIITDFLHLKPRGDFPFWYDALLLFSFAFTGLLIGIISAHIVFKKMKQVLAPWQAKGFMLFAMLISGYGIYVGRFLRYNTWDLLTNPLQITTDTVSRIFHPAIYPRTYGVTLMAGVLLSLVFFIFESILITE
jgi:uncharacterized membrane protein